MANAATPPTTPPAMAPLDVDEDDVKAKDVGDELCPVVVFVVGEEVVATLVNRGMVLLKIVLSALLLNPPCGEFTVAPPDGLLYI